MSEFHWAPNETQKSAEQEDVAGILLMNDFFQWGSRAFSSKSDKFGVINKALCECKRYRISYSACDKSSINSLLLISAAEFDKVGLLIQFGKRLQACMHLVVI